MGFQFRRRVRIGKGRYVNVSGSGMSYTRQTKWGSFGSSGVSIKTGIPGITFRHRFSRKKADPAAGLVIALLTLAVGLGLMVLQLALSLLSIVLQFLWLVVVWLTKVLFHITVYLLHVLFEGTKWVVLTSFDFSVYAAHGIRRWHQERQFRLAQPAVYYVARGGQPLGPFRADQIEWKLKTGGLKKTELFWREGMNEWERLSTFAQPRQLDSQCCDQGQDVGSCKGA